jgi:hypothetical protein
MSFLARRFGAPLVALGIVSKYPLLVAVSHAKPQNRTQQRVVNLDVSIVADQSELAKLIHEMTDAGSGGADHLRQRFLTNVRTDRLRVTGGVAVAAGLIAIWNIQSQRQIARKRAAFDVFLKTETDEKMLTAYDNFHAGIIEMKKVTSVEEFCTSELTRPHYLWIRKYLNVHELIAVGIRENVLDSNVCYSLGRCFDKRI